jgi:CMP/dCMP kinase
MELEKMHNGSHNSEVQKQNQNKTLNNDRRDSGAKAPGDIAKMKTLANAVETPFIVTIDGPAASGKSSVSREIARRFGWNWVSTGAFYRGLAYVAHRTNIDLTDENALVNLAQSSSWSVRLSPERTHVFLGEEDVTEEIGREHIGGLASKISSFPKVRAALLSAQRHCAEGVDGLVAEGRDCGTVIFPAAAVKIFLTARAEDRAARRAREEGMDLTKTIDEQKLRDSQDANRKTAPMLASAEANTIDTTDFSFEEVVGQVEQLVRARLP